MTIGNNTICCACFPQFFILFANTDTPIKLIIPLNNNAKKQKCFKFLSELSPKWLIRQERKIPVCPIPKNYKHFQLPREPSCNPLHIRTGKIYY